MGFWLWTLWQDQYLVYLGDKEIRDTKCHIRRDKKLWGNSVQFSIQFSIVKCFKLVFMLEVSEAPGKAKAELVE